MQSYIGFLRGINVGGQKKIKMTDLRLSLEKSGFSDVETYIQSGNLILKSEKQAKTIMSSVQECIQKDFGFEVPALVLTMGELKNILENMPFQNTEEKNLYFTLLHQKPNRDLVYSFKELQFENEDFVVAENCVYLNCKKGAGKAKLNNNLIENKLKVTATTRNLNTMLKMIEMGS